MPSDREALEVLRGRVRAAMVPDREIDKAISATFGPTNDFGVSVCAGFVGIGPFTSSIDAALRLVEQVLPGAEWSKSLGDRAHIYWRKQGAPRPIAGSGWHHHTPLAIVEALIGAVLSQPEPTDAH